MTRTRVVSLAVGLLLSLMASADATAAVRVGDSGWFWGNPLPHGNTMRDVEFAGLRGYAVGEAGAVLRTDDGGASWSGLPSGGPSFGGGSLSEVDVLNANTFVVPTAEGCTLRRSDDGGRSFRRVRVVPRDTRCPGPIVSFSFPSTNVGYAALGSGIVFRTTDGGATFVRRTPVPSTQVSGGDASGLKLHFVSPSVGVAVSDSPTTGYIHRTIDGGASWTQVASFGNGFKAVEFADALTGFAAGSDPGVVLKTVDGGANWTQAPMGGASRGTQVPPFTEIACQDSQTCLFGKTGEAPVRTTTGGVSVTGVAGLSSSEVLGYSSGGRAVALGQRGFTAVSNDRGAVFVRVDRRLPSELSSLRATSPSLAVAFGEAGQLALTRDAGRSWSFVGVPTSNEPADASFATPTVGYVLEAGGSVLRTRNGGQDWQDAASVGASGLLARAADTVVVAGRGGVRRSTNGAASFRRVGARALRGTRLSKLDAAGRAIFAFGGRALSRSTNEGRSWRRIRRPTRREIVDADFVNARVGYVIAEAGGAGQRLYRTSNAGRRWRWVRGVATRELYSVSFATARSGFVDADNDTARVLHTSDGGRTWRPQVISPTTLTVGGLAATRSGSALALNSDGDLFATTTGGDALGASSLTLRPSRRRLRRSARITLSGRLTPRLADEQIVIASLVRGRWRRRTVETTTDGSFTVRVGVRRSTRFVAQWDGDGASRGAGTGAVLVRVRR